MKRIWFAAAFLAFAVALGVYEQVSLRSACSAVESAADVVEQAVEDGDFERAVQLCAQAQGAWDREYARLSMLINHSVLDEEKTHFRVLSDTLRTGDAEEAVEAARELRAGARLTLESASVTPGNIF